MRIAVDRSLCQGHGQCQDAAPRAFEVDDEGLAVVLTPEVTDPEEIRMVEEAADRCPVQAISLES